LGVWSKGLEKGLLSYDKDTYDDERDMMKKITEIERIVRKTNRNANDSNIDIYTDDYMEEQALDAELEKDAFNMADMSEDYRDGIDVNDMDGEYEEREDEGDYS
jgi:hypothetical protein